MFGKELTASSHDEDSYRKMIDTVKPKIDIQLHPMQIEDMERRKHLGEDKRRKDDELLHTDNVNLLHRLSIAKTEYPKDKFTKETEKMKQDADKSKVLREQHRLHEMYNQERDNAQLQKRTSEVSSSYDRVALKKQLEFCDKQSDAHKRLQQQMKQINKKHIDRDNDLLAKRIATAPCQYGKEELQKNQEKLNADEQYRQKLRIHIKESDDKRIQIDNSLLAKRLSVVKPLFVPAKSDTKWKKKCEDHKSFCEKRTIESRTIAKKGIDRQNQSLNERLLSSKSNYPARELNLDYLTKKGRVAAYSRFPNKEAMDRDNKRLAELKNEKMVEAKLEKEKIEQRHAIQGKKRIANIKIATLSAFKK